MQNLPNITPVEVAVVVAAVVLLFVTPTLLAFADERRRRRADLAHQQRAQAAVLPTDVGLHPEPVVALPVREGADSSPAELRPLEGLSRHSFCLADLHQAQLPDWPPTAIRNDVERFTVWREAERAVQEQRVMISSAVIGSPYPARSTCLGFAEVAGGCLRLRFLLFPVFWPVSQNQAVAQAVFEIDGTGALRGWVDALRPHELTDENRQEIREGGGEP